MCDVVHFDLTKAGTGDSSHSFAVRVQERKADTRKTSSGIDASFGRNFARELSAQEWDDLLVVYTKAKEAVTESADLTTVPVYFPDDCDGTIFWYRGVLPHAAPFRSFVDGKPADAFDSYCAMPDCPCTEAFLTFVRVGENHRRLPDDYTEVRVSYSERKVVAVVRKAKRETPTPDVLVQALLKHHPDAWDRLRARHANMKALYRRWEAEREPPPLPDSTKKVGRNDPCPCGSGKKHKKCCL